MAIFTLFQRFRDEAAFIGRILAGYTDLEYALTLCVNATREDFDAILKAMFRTRGETQRIDIADALGRHSYDIVQLGTQFAMGVGAIRYCLKIRNQYAHCLWWDDYSGSLTFADLQEVANENTLATDLRNLTSHHVTPDLLRLQEQYFLYTDRLLIWLNWEARLRMRRVLQNPHQAPAQLMQPALHTP